MLMMISILILLTLLFMMMKHPLSMGGILLMQVMIISIISGIMSLNFWFSYILFIIMIGGMMVLFIYMTSVASNEKFVYKSMMIVTIVLLMFLMIWMNLDYYLNYFTFNNLDSFKFNNMIMFELCFNKFIYYPLTLMFISMMFYLLITLIAVVKITNIKNGPLKQKF